MKVQVLMVFKDGSEYSENFSSWDNANMAMTWYEDDIEIREVYMKEVEE